jgi:ribosome-binding ATPase YchF (GTP1/OBG family)
MIIGLVGAPNKGKSTIFSAVTKTDVDIADYPFTTIKPNFGVAYANKPCVDKELNVKCNPRNSMCINGIRRMPINIVDVAGLVPDASSGKGMGHPFLNDLMQADALIQVVDLTGKTDMQGNHCEHSDPADEVLMVKKEIANWLGSILEKHMANIYRRPDGDAALKEILAGFNISLEQIHKAAEMSYLRTSEIKWKKEDIYAFADSLIKINKPIIVAANKQDAVKDGALEALKSRLKDNIVIGCSGAIELTLVKAAKSGIIDYVPGSSSFEIKKEVSGGQKKALDYISGYLNVHKTTGIQELINAATFDLLKNMVVYPVEDENKYTDHNGNVLPDAILLQIGSNAQDLAAKIHTELAKGMLYAIDAKRKTRIGKDYVLKDNDVIKIVSAR